MKNSSSSIEHQYKKQEYIIGGASVLSVFLGLNSLGLGVALAQTCTNNTCTGSAIVNADKEGYFGDKTWYFRDDTIVNLTSKNTMIYTRDSQLQYSDYTYFYDNATLNVNAADAISGGLQTIVGSGVKVNVNASRGISGGQMNLKGILNVNAQDGITSEVYFGAGDNGVVNLNVAKAYTGSSMGLYARSSSSGAVVNAKVTDSLAAGVVTFQGGGLINVLADNAINNKTNIYFSSAFSTYGGLLFLNGHDQTLSGISELSDYSVATIANNGNSASTLTLSADTNPSKDGYWTFRGNIKDSTTAATGRLNLVKSGSHDLLLAGQSTYTGSTTVNAGKLTAGSATGLTTNTEYSVHGGTLDLNGYDLSVSSFGGAGGEVALGRGTLRVNQAVTRAYAGSMTGSGGLIKEGTGTLTLSGQNRYTGKTTISAGTLQAGSAAGLAADTDYTLTGGRLDLNSYNVQIASLQGSGGTVALGSATLKVNQAQNTQYAGSIVGAGSLVKSGAGTLTFSGVNSFSGGTTISAGKLVGTTSSLGTGAIVNNAQLVFDQSGSGTHSADIYGTGSVSKEGTGTVTLLGANGFSGGTTIREGKLIGSISSLGSGAIVNNAQLVFNQSGSGTHSADISGTGSVSKEGTGTVTLSGANSFSGGTTIREGKLIGSISSLGSGAIVNNAQLVFNQSSNGMHGAEISGTGSVSKEGTGTVTLSGTNGFSGGTTISAGKLIGTTASLGSGAIVNNAQLELNQNSDGAVQAALSGTGSLIKSGTGTVHLMGSVDYTGDTTISNGALAVTGAFRLENNKALNLTTTSATPTLLANTVSLGSGTRFNLTGISDTTQLDRVLIQTTKGITGDFATVTVGGFQGDVDYVTLVTKKSSDNTKFLATTGLSWYAASNLAHGRFTLTGHNNSFDIGVGLNNQAANAVTGWNGSTLTKRGAGTLVLWADNGYTGGTSIDDGTLQIGQGGHTGSVLGAITNRSTLVFNRSDAFTSTNTISGSGNVVQAGSGTVVLAGQNSYSGGTTIAAGTVSVGADHNLGATTGAVLFNGGGLEVTNGFATARNLALNADATITVAANQTLAVSGQLVGVGALLKSGEGTLRLDNGANAYRDTVVAKGALIGSAASLKGNVGNAGRVIFDQASDAAFVGDIVGYQGGKGQMVKEGLGRLTLQGLSTLDWAIEAGEIATAAERFAGNASLAAGSGLIFNQQQHAIANNLLTGQGGVTKQGAGALILTANNSYTGGTVIDAGILQIGNGGNTGSVVGDITTQGQLVFNRSNAVTAANTISGHGDVVQAGSGTLVLAGQNSYSGGTTIAAGTVSVGADHNLGAATGAIAFNGGSLDVTTSFTTARNLALNDHANIAVAANQTLAVSGRLAGAGALIKSGEGTLHLDNTRNAYRDTVVAKGTLVGSVASLSGNVSNAGKVIFNQATDATFAGDMISYQGSKGLMVKEGVGRLTLQGTSTLDWTIATGEVETAAERFVGNANVAAGTSLIFNQQQQARAGNVISGQGSVIKQGVGALELTADNGAFAGMTQVNEGLLVVNGTLGGNLKVADGSSLGGSGTVGSGNGSLLSMESGATLATGNSIGTLTVNGDLLFASGALFAVEVDPASQASDHVRVLGKATLKGGSVAHIGAQGKYNLRSRYTILSAQDGLAGQFEHVRSDFAFLDPSLLYDYKAGSIALQLNRNDVAFAEKAQTRNQRATAAAVDSIGVAAAHPVYDAMALLPDNAALIGYSLNQLSGEAYASTRGALLNQSSATRESVSNRLQQAFGDAPISPIAVRAAGSSAEPQATTSTEHNAVWGTTFGSWNTADGDGNASTHKATVGGFTAGIDRAVADTWRVGVLAGYSHSTFKNDELNSSAKSDNFTLGAYAGSQWAISQGSLMLHAGAMYTRHNLEMKRNVSFADFSDKVSADYHGDSFQVFGELGYKVDVASQTAVEPYANLAYVKVRTNGFTEEGAKGAALQVNAKSSDATLSTLGVKASTHFDVGNVAVTAQANIGWRHAYGNVVPVSTARFAGSNTFTVDGTPLSKDVALTEVSVRVQLSDRTTLGVGYQGQFGSGTKQNSVSANVNLQF